MRGSRIDKVKGLIALAVLLVLSAAIVVVFSVMGKARTQTDVYAQPPVPTSTMVRGPISPLPTPRAIPTPTYPVAPPTPTWSPPPVLSGPGAIDFSAYFRDDGGIRLYRFVGGDKLVAWVLSKGNLATQYFLIDVDGRNKQRLSELEAAIQLSFNDSLWYSPDGRKIAFEKRSPKSSELWVVDSRGRNPIRVAAQPDMFQQFAAWSSDSSKLAYFSYAWLSHKKSIWVVNADGTGARQIVEPRETGFRNATWSPDSSELVVVAGSEDGNQLYALNADGTNMREIGKFIDPVEFPNIGDGVAWSPDGKQVVYSATFSPPRISRFQPFHSLWLAGLDGSAPKALTSELSSTPIWLPNGKIRYVTIDQPNRKYVVKEIDPETRSVRSLLDFPRETDEITLAIGATWAAGGDVLIASPMADRNGPRLVKIK